MAQPGSTGEAVGENAMPASACSAAVNHESLHQTTRVNYEAVALEYKECQ